MNTSRMATSIFSLLWVAIFAIPILVPNVRSSKILLYPGPGSHYLRATVLGEELVARGHMVTILLRDDQEYRAMEPHHAKLFSFSISSNRISPAEKLRIIESLDSSTFTGGWKLKAYYDLAIARKQRLCKNALDEKVLKELIDTEFDLLISDPSISLPCHDGLGKHLGVPKGFIMTGSLFPNILRQNGLRVNPAVTPELGLGFPSHMTFSQRVVNVLYSSIMGAFLSIYREEPTWQNSVIKESDSSLPLADFVILAADPLIDKVISLPPGYITAAGLTTRPAGPIEKKLEDFMQSSGDHGAIIFTIGNSATHLSEDMLEAFRDAFSKLPQKVIWQWKNKKSLENAPGNVMTLDWLPQNDLLGHNKTRLFIYQGGNNGLYEAIYHGVPLIVIPLNYDQPDVAQNVAEKEIGVRLNVAEVTAETLGKCINNVLTDEKYETNMKRMSTMFRDRVQTPKEKAATFVEHVLKYGVEHLRTPGSDMSFIQYYLVDVMAFLLFCSLTLILIAYLTLKYTVRLMGSFVLSRKDKRE